MAHSHADGAHAAPTFRSRPRATGEVISRVGVYLRPYKLMVGGTVGCAVLALASSLVFPGMIHVLVDYVFTQHKYSWLAPASIVLIGAYFFRELFNSLRIRINNSLEQNVIFVLCCVVFGCFFCLFVVWF